MHTFAFGYGRAAQLQLAAASYSVTLTKKDGVEEALEMYKLDIRVDGREAAAVERRRLQERERQARIFNARQRTIGVRARE